MYLYSLRPLYSVRQVTDEKQARAPCAKEVEQGVQKGQRAEHLSSGFPCPPHVEWRRHFANGQDCQLLCQQPEQNLPAPCFYILQCREERAYGAHDLYHKYIKDSKPIFSHSFMCSYRIGRVLVGQWKHCFYITCFFLTTTQATRVNCGTKVLLQDKRTWYVVWMRRFRWYMWMPGACQCHTWGIKRSSFEG